jgi:hypothetical protein
MTLSINQQSKQEYFGATNATGSRTVVAVAGAAALVDQDGHQLVARRRLVGGRPTLGRRAVSQAAARVLAACRISRTTTLKPQCSWLRVLCTIRLKTTCLDSGSSCSSRMLATLVVAASHARRAQASGRYEHVLFGQAYTLQQSLLITTAFAG